MKIINMLALLFLLCFSIGCHKEELEEGVQGTWKLESTSGTITGQGIKTDWNKMSIKDDDVTFFKDNTEIQKATLSFKHDAAANKHSLTFSFDNESAVIGDLKGDPLKFYNVSGNKLLLSSECCDRVNYNLVKE